MNSIHLVEKNVQADSSLEFQLRQVGVRGAFEQSVSLADYTSWRVGGCAEYLFKPADKQDLQLCLSHLPKGMPITYLGLGSNTLVRDGGVSGVVIITQGALMSCEVLDPSHQLFQTNYPDLIRAEAGVSCASLARTSARMGLTGLEFMAGIPGTVGGALAMNAGCFGGETWTHLAWLEVMDQYGNIQIKPRSEFQFAYRFVQRNPNDCFLAGIFSLPQGNRDDSLKQIKILLEKRQATQPTGTANSGSVFKNPPGDFAGRLIEACGLKGKSQGGAYVSAKHANFILNESDATAFDIESLIFFVRDTVSMQTGIFLEPEVHLIGKPKD